MPCPICKDSTVKCGGCKQANTKGVGLKYEIPVKMCKTGCGRESEAERYEFCVKCWWDQDPRNIKNGGTVDLEKSMSEKDRDPRQPAERVERPLISVNQRLILEPYTADRGLRANVQSGFAVVDQKVGLKGLKVLVEAYINENGRQTSMVIQRGSIAYIREEVLFNAPWAKKNFKSDAIEGDFIIVDLQHIEFIKPL